MLRTRILMLVAAALLTGGLLGACSSDDAGGGSAGTTSGAGDDGHGGAHDHSHASPVAPGARQVPVNVWAFGFEPREIAGSVGEDLDIVLTSQDVLHDFTVEGLEAHVSSEPDRVGHGGVHRSGVRLGGVAMGRSALKVAEERRYQSYRTDATVGVRQLELALRRLRPQ